MVGYFLDELLRAHVRGPTNISVGFGKARFLEAIVVSVSDS